MALIKCSDCGKEVSDRAKVCIHCGYPIRDVSMNTSTAMLNNESYRVSPFNDNINAVPSHGLYCSPPLEQRIALTTNIEGYPSAPVEQKRNSKKPLVIILSVVVFVVVLASLLVGSGVEKTGVITGMLGFFSLLFLLAFITSLIIASVSKRKKSTSVYGIAACIIVFFFAMVLHSHGVTDLDATPVTLPNATIQETSPEHPIIDANLGDDDSQPPLLAPPMQLQGLHYTFTNTQERIYESYGQVRYKTLIEITNTGSVVIYLDISRYDLIDNSGRILRAGNVFSTFPDILHPGEKGYFYDNVEVMDVSVNTEIILVPRWDIRQSREERTNLNLSEVEIRNVRNGTAVFGRITNNTGKAQTWVIITVVLYAFDGSPIGVWMTNVMETIPNETTIGFEISRASNYTLYETVTPDMVGSFVAYAYPLQWQFW